MVAELGVPIHHSVYPLQQQRASTAAMVQPAATANHRGEPRAVEAAAGAAPAAVAAGTEAPPMPGLMHLAAPVSPSATASPSAKVQRRASSMPSKRTNEQAQQVRPKVFVTASPMPNFDEDASGAKFRDWVIERLKKVEKDILAVGDI